MLPLDDGVEGEDDDGTSLPLVPSAGCVFDWVSAVVLGFASSAMIVVAGLVLLVFEIAAELDCDWKSHLFRPQFQWLWKFSS